MIKRFVQLALLILFGAIGVSAQSTISGTVLIPSGASGSRIRVCFTLTNTGGNPPRIVGTGTIVQHRDFCVTPNSATGAWSTSLYLNSSIETGGVTGNTRWRVDWKFDGVQTASATYNLTTAGDLNSMTPVSSAPTVTANTSLVQSYVHQQTSAATTWTVTHNFGDANVICAAYNSSGVLFEDSDITSRTQTSATAFTFVFGSSQTGSAICQRASSIALLSSNLASAILSTPTANQSIAGGYSLTFDTGVVGKLNNTLIVDGIKFTTCNSAISAAGSSQTKVVLPSNYAGADCSSVPVNVVIEDLRNTVVPVGNVAPYSIANAYRGFLGSGTTRQFLFGSQIIASAGGDGTEAVGEGVAGFFGAQRTAGTRPIWALNTVTACDVTGNACYGVEIDLNAGYNSAVTSSASDQQIGLKIISGATKTPLAAISVTASTPSTGSWLIGADIQNWSTFGVRIGAPVATGNPNLYLVPQANDSNNMIVGRNAADNATVWSIQNVGNASFSLVTSIFQDTSASPAATGNVRLGTSGQLNFRNNANGADVNGVSKTTGDVVVLGGTAGTQSYRMLTQGTDLVSGDFALHANWGNSASVAVDADGKDEAWRITVTSAGTGQGASPTVILTFKTAYSIAPICLINQQGGTGARADVDVSTSTTTATLTWVATPVAASTYTFAGICRGVVD